MLDIRYVRDNKETVKKALRDRSDDVTLIKRFAEADKARRELIQKAESLKCEKNRMSAEIGERIKNGESPEEAKKEVIDMSGRIEALDAELDAVDKDFFALCDRIPNIPHSSVPVGASEEDNPVVKEVGEKKVFSFMPREHLELGELCGIFDLSRASKMTGSGFPLFTGQGARLERALINYMLDIHTAEHGYTEVAPPFLVNRSSMRGTGQIPKLEEDMYKVEKEDLFLIPTAEVPVTNFHADEVIEEEKLPILYTAYTACFRREAGSYGKDTKGLVRVHQFDKVELVKFVHPDNSIEELNRLLSDAEKILKNLGLSYRIIELCTADLSFAAEKCYDIELWAPASERWLEVSSCSVFGDFQARRANIKYQPEDHSLKARYLHTLNGSGVALPRLVIALLETFQQEDGSVLIPEAVVPYFGAERIKPINKKST